MRIAGVHLDDGRRVWADAVECELAPLDRVRVDFASGETHGWIFITPEQLLGDPPPVAATIRAVVPSAPPKALDQDLPGADLPPLGTRTTMRGTTGIVTTIDPVKRTVTVTRDDGEIAVEPSS